MMNPELPYFICLDEMNLARVEYYFSDILFLMETRRLNEDNEIRNLQASYGTLIKGKDHNQFVEHFISNHKIIELNRD